MLYIVSTPIGNLKDITLRALETLKEVDYILCEDTRVTGKLLHAYLIEKPMQTITDFNEEKKVALVIADLKEGKNIALVSDAGTPLVSDPGYKLVREAIKERIRVEAIAGVSAAITALTLSGLPPDKFMFLGYLPKKEGKKKEFLKTLKEIPVKTTFIFYESPFRVLDTLESMLEVFGDIEVVVARELTKMHEEVRKGPASKQIEYFKTKTPKGEFVILL